MTAVPFFSQLLTLFNQQMFSLFCHLFTWFSQLFNGSCHLSPGGSGSCHLVLPAGILFCQLASCSASWHLVLPAVTLFCQLSPCSASCHLVLPAVILFCQLYLVLPAVILFCQLYLVLPADHQLFACDSAGSSPGSASWFNLFSQLVA